MSVEFSEEEYHDHWYGPDVATFGDRLAASREYVGLSQEVFATRLGVKESTVVEWEDDIAEPRANRLTMMAGLLNVSIAWLLTGEGEGVADNYAREEALDTNLTGLLAEVRDTRSDLKSAYDKLGRLEKKLRLKIRSGENA